VSNKEGRNLSKFTTNGALYEWMERHRSEMTMLQLVNDRVCFGRRGWKRANCNL